MKTNSFGYKKEAGLNPYIGFDSFQHFRGEALYSDVVVRPENKMCETENFECYPIGEDVPQNGREEGYYPDTSVAYIRVLWKEFEPQRGVYNYDFIQKILDDAKAHGQTVIFRLMAHSTRPQDDVPDWLKNLIPCPERPAGERVKDSPTDPLFLELFSEAVRKIGERFDDDPTFDVIDISLPGSWGEGHKLENYSQESLTKLVDTYTSVFKKTNLVGQSYLPDLLAYASKEKPVGWRGDGFGNPEHMEKLYPPRIEKIKDLWKTAPVSFESYWWLGEWQRRGWDIDKIIEMSLNWHLSSFNAKSAPIPFEWKEKIDAWVDKMGYHYVIDSFSFPEEATDMASFELNVDNVGVAPIYRPADLKIKLSKGEKEYVFDTNVDIRKWMPGKHSEKIEIALGNVDAGEYDISIGLSNEVAPVMYFCSDAEFDGAFYKLGSFKVK